MENFETNSFKNNFLSKKNYSDAIVNHIDVDTLQSLFDQFYKSTGLGISLVTTDNKRLARAGWQHICTHFHTTHPEASAICKNSEKYFEENIEPKIAITHKCKNGLYERAIGLYDGSDRIGILFFGQYFKKDEPIDKNYFVKQAEKYQFEIDSYLSDLKQVPILDEEKIDSHINLMKIIIQTITGLR